MDKHLLFVYGTLKRGWGNNAIISDQKFVTAAITESNGYQMWSLGGYPGVKRGDKPIVGEVWEVDDAAFKRCDGLEGHPTFYCREETSVKDSEGRVYTCWMYIYQYELRANQKPIDIW